MGFFANLLAKLCGDKKAVPEDGELAPRLVNPKAPNSDESNRPRARIESPAIPPPKKRSSRSVWRDTSLLADSVISSRDGEQPEARPDSPASAARSASASPAPSKQATMRGSDPVEAPSRVASAASVQAVPEEPRIPTPVPKVQSVRSRASDRQASGERFSLGMMRQQLRDASGSSESTVYSEWQPKVREPLAYRKYTLATPASLEYEARKEESKRALAMLLGERVDRCGP